MRQTLDALPISIWCPIFSDLGPPHQPAHLPAPDRTADHRASIKRPRAFQGKTPTASSSIATYPTADLLHPVRRNRSATLSSACAKKKAFTTTSNTSTDTIFWYSGDDQTSFPKTGPTYGLYPRQRPGRRRASNKAASPCASKPRPQPAFTRRDYDFEKPHLLMGSSAQDRTAGRRRSNRQPHCLI